MPSCCTQTDLPIGKKPNLGYFTTKQGVKRFTLCVMVWQLTCAINLIKNIATMNSKMVTRFYR